MQEEVSWTWTGIAPPDRACGDKALSADERRLFAPRHGAPWIDDPAPRGTDRTRPRKEQHRLSAHRMPRPQLRPSFPVWSKNSADGQRVEGLLVLGWNPPDFRSNLFASGSMSARRSWLPIGRPAEGDAGECLDQTRAAGAQSQIVMEVGKGIRQLGGSSTAACRPVAHGTRSCRLCKAIRRPVRCRVL